MIEGGAKRKGVSVMFVVVSFVCDGFSFFKTSVEIVRPWYTSTIYSYSQASGCQILRELNLPVRAHRVTLDHGIILPFSH
jgi:hypothetical protein